MNEHWEREPIDFRPHGRKFFVCEFLTGHIGQLHHAGRAVLYATRELGVRVIGILPRDRGHPLDSVWPRAALLRHRVVDDLRSLEAGRAIAEETVRTGE